MASLRDIRRRIRSIRGTAKITRAMQMIAVTKMKKAQVSAAAGVHYADLLNDILVQATQYFESAHASPHPIMGAREINARAVVLVSTDRGLCGALNSNLFRECNAFDTDSTLFVAIGRKAAQFVRRTRRQLLVEFHYSDPPRLSEARSVSRFLAQLYLDGAVDAVDVMFTNFISTFKQAPIRWKFLPAGQIQDAVSQLPISLQRKKPDLRAKNMGEFEFEPNARVVYEEFLLQSLDYQLLQIMREVRASEHSARMVAMKQATDNAEEMIAQLELAYNKLRQTAITNELLDICGAGAASS